MCCRNSKTEVKPETWDEPELGPQDLSSFDGVCTAVIVASLLGFWVVVIAAIKYLCA
jgi:hypothetical protein